MISHKVTSRALLFLLSGIILFAQQVNPSRVDEILRAYVQAVGGEEALQQITSREVLGTLHGHLDPGEIAVKKKSVPKLGAKEITCYWQRPDKAVETVTVRSAILEEIGFDGKSAWRITPNKKTKSPDNDEQDDLETTANALRFVFLKSLYPGVQAAAPGSAESNGLDVLIASTDDGKRKSFYFDHKTHLLLLIISVVSAGKAYFEHTIHFDDYRTVDGVKYPFRILFTPSDGSKNEIRISKVLHNVPIQPKQFVHP